MVQQPLRTEDLLIAFIDLQEGIVNVGTTADPERLRQGVAALAQLAAIFSIPIVISSVPTTSGTVSPPLTEIRQRFPDAEPHVRTTANAIDDEPFRATLDAAGRRTLIVAGVATEVAIALAATAAQRLGYAVIVAVDACSGLDARTESTTFIQLSAAGVTLSSVPGIAAELAGDFATESGRAAMGALQSMLASHAHGHSDHDHDRHNGSTFA